MYSCRYCDTVLDTKEWCDCPLALRDQDAIRGIWSYDHRMFKIAEGMGRAYVR